MRVINLCAGEAGYDLLLRTLLPGTFVASLSPAALRAAATAARSWDCKLHGQCRTNYFHQLSDAGPRRDCWSMTRGSIGLSLSKDLTREQKDTLLEHG